MGKSKIAIIGGSGLYDLDGLKNVEKHTVETPYGNPSSAIVSGELENTQLMFLARHGEGHRYTPSEVNYRANIFALKKLGATKVLSVSAVGSMREDIPPGDIVIVDQYVDNTKGRPNTFFGNGIVGHVMFSDPTCPALNQDLLNVAKSLDLSVHFGGTLMTMEGPAFSTRAESVLHKKLGIDLIGMTAMPEAKLAREAELCYATLALATDYDSWREEEEGVTVDEIIAVMKKNVDNAKNIIRTLAKTEASTLGCGCAKALEYAVMTDREQIPSALKDTMKPIFGRVL